MNFIKKLNLLDYIIIISFLLIVFLTVYNFFPRSGNDGEYTLYIHSGNADVKEGALCTDSRNGNNLGKAELLGGDVRTFSITFKGNRAVHGISSKGERYLVGMTVPFYVGDSLVEGEVLTIYP